MHKFLLSGIALFLQLLAPAQQAAVTPNRVMYRFEHTPDTNRLQAKRVEMMMLDFSEQGSRYASHLRHSEDSILSKTTMSIGNEVKVPRGNSERIFFTFDASKRWIVRQGFPDLVAIPDTALFIPWQLQSQTKLIAGLTCQLATGRFRGREYDAWFCPDIPVPAGPWKLQGLPGLIVEASDRSGTVRFSFQGMHPIPSIQLNPPAEAKLQSQQEYDAAIERIKRDPEGYINNMMQAGRTSEKSQSGRMRVTNVDQLKERAKNGINNPLELTQ